MNATVMNRKANQPVLEAPVDVEFRKRIAARRAASKVRGVHHHVYYSRDAEETRHFYEDILGFPLTGAAVIKNDFVDGAGYTDKHKKGGTYCHMFFELGSGSLAFVDFPEYFSEPAPTPTPDGFRHHIAVEVMGDVVLREYEEKLKAHNVNYLFIDHGPFHSLMFPDPNNLLVELVSETPTTEGVMQLTELTARADLAKYMKDTVAFRKPKNKPGG